jgi:peptidoglycan/LPS O-acetylase OafA/YrhL
MKLVFQAAALKAAREQLSKAIAIIERSMGLGELDMPLRVERLYLLDVLRGLASLSVVIWHYQHFYYVGPGTSAPNFDRTAQPLYFLFAPLYEHGGFAVQLFFALSGFIFFHQYAEPIRRGSVSAYEFTVLRMSRLYPLHFVTLIFVAVGQAIAYATTSQFVVYPCNDAAHFVANLFLVSQWVLVSQQCWSFNAPIWSVSVELFLYICFFLFALRLPARWSAQFLLTLAIIATGIAINVAGLFHLLGEPIFCFFAGGLAYLLWSRMQWHTSFLQRATASLLALAALVAVRLVGLSSILVGAVVFPALILALALWQSTEREAGKRARLIGDITYSTYLLHFPIQLSLILPATKAKRAIRLLCPRHERPPDRRANQAGNKFAPPHSITSSAWTMMDGGKVMPSSLAVLRFTTSSTFMGCSMGRSAGFFRLRILST